MISVFNYETGAMRFVFAITNGIIGRSLWEAMIFNSLKINVLVVGLPFNSKQNIFMISSKYTRRGLDVHEHQIKSYFIHENSFMYRHNLYIYIF